MVCEAAKFLWIHAQLSGHLDVRMTEVVLLSSIYPDLQIFGNALLRHDVTGRNPKSCAFDSGLVRVAGAQVPYLNGQLRTSLLECAASVKKWCPRRDSNARPLA